MLQGLKTTDRQRTIVDDYVVRGKSDRAHCPNTVRQWTCPNDTIDVERMMLEQLENGEHDVLQYIRARPKTNQFQKAIHNGPTVNEYGIPADLIMEMNPGDMRTKGQKLTSIAPVSTSFGSHLRSKVVRSRPISRKCFKDHIDVGTALGVNPKHKKKPRRRMQRLKDKTELLLDGTDRTMGQRKEIDDKRALEHLQEKIEILQQTIAEYKKGTRKEMDMQHYLKEHVEILQQTMATMSKEAKGRDLTKELVREYQELVREGGRAYKVRRKQYQKIKLAEQRKRVIAESAVNGKKKQVMNRRLDECFASDQHLRMGQHFVEADRYVPRPHSMPVPRGTLKP